MFYTLVMDSVQSKLLLASSLMPSRFAFHLVILIKAVLYSMKIKEQTRKIASGVAQAPLWGCR